MKKKVLILGNGFDLDLGWKTSFQEFVKSDYWPLKDKQPNSPMADHIANRIQVERWYDVMG